MIDYELPRPIKGVIERCALYDMDESKTGVESCVCFALTSYKNRAPTLKILLDDGSLFSFIPIHLFYFQNPYEQPDVPELFTLNELAYKNCPDYEMAITSPKFLQGRTHNYIHQHDRWIDGNYILSADWHKQNLILHLIALDNGQLAMLPSHKVKFHEGEKSFRDYRKISHIWEV